jgi:hypothetical protein
MPGSERKAVRKVLSLAKLVEDPENERKTFDDMDDLVASASDGPDRRALLPDRDLPAGD